jgi:hypothetical protein
MAQPNVEDAFAHRTSVPGFLRLPMEIRLQIYYLLIPRKHLLSVVRPQFTTAKALVIKTLDFKAVEDVSSEDGVQNLEENTVDGSELEKSKTDLEEDVP